RGNPARTRLNTREPHPPPVDAAFDTPPSVLADDPVAAAEWARVGPILRTCGVVTESDRSVLIALCQQWSRYLDATDKVKTLGMLVKDANGHPARNPFLAIADAALAHCRQLWAELGLTPSSRSRITALPETLPSKWAGLLP